MRKLFFIILFCFGSSSAFSQYYPEVWDSTMVYENEYYKIEVPKNWRYNKAVTTDLILHHFEGSGIGFPVLVNDNPLIINVSILNPGQFNSMDSLAESVMSEINKNKGTDKIFEEGFVPLMNKVTVKSGEEAKILKHQYFRKSKNLNQTRYDMLLINPNTKEAFVYTLSIQYLGEYDSFESYLKLDEFADNVYKRFELK